MTKKIIILYDPFPTKYEKVKTNLKDYTRFRIWGNIPMVESNDLTNDLIQLSNEYDWAGVVAIGNYVTGQHAIDNTIEYGIKENVPLVCHILNKGGYYHFHSQWFAINLAEWRVAGCPAFEECEPGPIQSATVIRDPNNVHDDYTPWWIKPGEGQTEYTTDAGYFGINVINQLINAGHKIVNVPEQIRGEKCYSYPEHYYEQLIDLIGDPNYKVPEEFVTNSGLYWFHKSINQSLEQLSKGFYVLNTEPMIALPDVELDCFVGVCGGVKPACIVGSENFSANTKVHLMDISQAALDWQQYLVGQWNGNLDGLQKVFEAFKIKYPEYMHMYYTHMSFEDNIKWYLNSGQITKEEFYTRWQKYRACDISYHKINLLSQDAADEIVAMIQDSSASYIWTSNSFYMDYLVLYKTQKGTEQLSSDFIEKILKKVSKPLYFENCNQLQKFNCQHG